LALILPVRKSISNYTGRTDIGTRTENALSWTHSAADCSVYKISDRTNGTNLTVGSTTLKTIGNLTAGETLAHDQDVILALSTVCAAADTVAGCINRTGIVCQCSVAITRQTICWLIVTASCTGKLAV
jgi:hypothetical protein